MNYFIEITLLPDPELKETVLLNSVYIRFHKALFDLRSTSIGISFPKYKVTLGSVLRIHGDKASLNDLQGLNWIGSLSDYCQIGDMTSVPVEVKFRNVSRSQSTMTQSKLKRLLKRGSITEEEAQDYLAKMFITRMDDPYVELMSGSSGHKYRRYIKFGELLDVPVAGSFDQFGLSKTATVPWFD